MKYLVLVAIASILFATPLTAQQSNSTVNKTENAKVTRHHKKKKHRFANGTADQQRQAGKVTGPAANPETQAAKQVAPTY